MSHIGILLRILADRLARISGGPGSRDLPGIPIFLMIHKRFLSVFLDMISILYLFFQRTSTIFIQNSFRGIHEDFTSAIFRFHLFYVILKIQDIKKLIRRDSVAYL